MSSALRIAAVLLLAGVFAGVECRRHLHTVAPDHRVLLTDRKGETNVIDTTLKNIANSYDKSPDGSGVVLGEVRTIKGDVLEVSNNPDFVSLLPQGNDIYSFVHFEAPTPSEMYMMKLRVDDKGDLKPVSWKRVDWSPFGGLWVPCAGSVTPWNSHLGSEEYEPDARAVADFIAGKEELEEDVASFMRYWGPGQNTTEGVKKYFKPYHYGHVTEAEATPKGDYKINKWYSMGRIAMELPLVMPDLKTVYLTDDGDNVGFFKFVADKKGDLNKGSLYAAKFKQQSAQNGGKFTVTWILLGKGDQAVLKPLADKLTFYDIFNAGNASDCKAPFKLSNKAGKVECLQVKPGMENAAAFFETRRYAAYLGATTEWSKWEGVTYDPLRKKLYTAISENKNGMEDSMVKGKADGKFDDGNNNDIRLPYNQCGCVYSMDVDNNYSATTMDALICGTPKDSKSCDVNAIANPDNVSFMEGYGVLLIGEDSSYHAPNLLWAYDVANKKLKKLAEALPGAENTGTYFYDNIKGKQYIINVFQHPDNGVHAEINFIGPLSLKKSEPVVFDTPYDEI